MTTTTAHYPDVDFSVMPHQGLHVPEFHEIMAEVRAADGPVPVTFYGGIGWLVARYDDVVAGFQAEEDLSSRATHELMTWPVTGRNLVGFEGDEHDEMRALVSPFFRRTVIPSYIEQHIRPVCESLIDTFIDDGTADLVTQFTRRYPVSVIGNLLGTPADDIDKFQRWAFALLTYPSDPEGGRIASEEYTAYLATLIAERREGPGDDLLSVLLSADVEGRRLEDEEIYAFLRLLFPAGADTTYLGVGTMIGALLAHPDVMARVREDPVARDHAVEETLRWEPPASVVPRVVPNGVEWGGRWIEPGSIMLLGVTGANRDPSRYPDPDSFQLDRATGGMATFGVGRHYCLGAWLARTEMRVALDVILERLDDLRLMEEPRMVGTVMRGPDRLPVSFSKIR